MHNFPSRRGKCRGKMENELPEIYNTVGFQRPEQPSVKVTHVTLLFKAGQKWHDGIYSSPTQPTCWMTCSHLWKPTSTFNTGADVSHCLDCLTDGLFSTSLWQMWSDRLFVSYSLAHCPVRQLYCTTLYSSLPVTAHYQSLHHQHFHLSSPATLSQRLSSNGKKKKKN